MKNWHASKAFRRACFAASLVSCIAILGCIVVPTWAIFAERDNRIAERSIFLARLQSIAAQESHIQSVAQRLDSERGEFLIGPNDGVINADLQTQLKRLAEAAGARVRSLQGLPAITEQVRYSGARMEIFGPIESIHRAIHAIESARPYLFVTGASIRGSPPSGGRSGNSEEPIVQARLDVFGAVRMQGRVP